MASFTSRCSMGEGENADKQPKSLFVGCIVGRKVAHLTFSEDTHDARNAGTTTGYNANIVGRVLRGLALAIQVIVVGCHLFAQFIEARDGRVLELGVGNGEGEGTGRSIFETRNERKSSFKKSEKQKKDGRV